MLFFDIGPPMWTASDDIHAISAPTYDGCEHNMIYAQDIWQQIGGGRTSRYMARWPQMRLHPCLPLPL
eukprot:6621186-Heterocapsa_arctica.AAC.1